MKASYNKGMLTIQGKVSEYSRMQAIASNLVKTGNYVDTQCGDEDNGQGEAWIVLSTDETIKEMQKDYKQAKANQ